MDYLGLSQLIEKRKKLITLEKDVDQKLIEMYDECPFTVFQYIMAGRELHRKNAQSLYDSSLLNYVSEARKSLEMGEKYYNPVNGDCKRLLHIVKDLGDELNRIK